MGQDGLTELTLTGTSTEKVTDALSALDTIDTGGDEQLAQALAAAKMIGLPAIVQGFLPEDPRELDRHLETGARLMLGLRSDHARNLSVLEVQTDPPLGVGPGEEDTDDAG